MPTGTAQPTLWRLAHGRTITLDCPRVLAILNVTPDSFVASSRTPAVEAAWSAARRAVDDGADMLDIGGESTRPGAAAVPAPEQIARVVPVIRAVRDGPPGDADHALRTIRISVDTCSAEVAAAALDAGADAVNDVSGATHDPGMLALVAARGAGLVLMHRLTEPARDSYSDRYVTPPEYADVVATVRGALAARMEAASRAGISADQIVLDPGLGFGKSVSQNVELITRTPELLSLGRPILSAVSRKSFVGRISLERESDPEERLEGSLAVTTIHLLRGARLFRTHDPRATRRALTAAWRLLGANATIGLADSVECE